MFYNCEYGQVSQKCKKSYCFSKVQKNMYLHVFLDLITSLLKPFELDLYFKNTNFFFQLVYVIMNLYIIHISYIK
jgi:hypothetical protein